MNRELIMPRQEPRGLERLFHFCIRLSNWEQQLPFLASAAPKSGLF